MAARKPKKEVRDIEGLEEKKSGKARSNIPVVKLEGDAPQRYNEIKAQIKKLEETLETLKASLVERGLEEVFMRNIQNPDEPVSSVFLEAGESDPAGNVPRVMFTWTTSHNKFKMDAVTAVLTDPENRSAREPKIAVDPNNYVGWGTVAEFDTDVFIVDDAFSPVRFGMFKSALDAVSKELKVENPLSVYKAPVVKNEADTLRFKELSFSGNLALSEVFPTTLKLEPVVPKVE